MTQILPVKSALPSRISYSPGTKSKYIQVNDGVQAVDCLQRQAEEISLLLLDIVMPHMDGSRFFLI